MEKIFSARLKEERTKQNFTQQQLADLINSSGKLNKKISRNSITRYENGTRTPDIDTLYAIADILEVDTDFLLGKSDCKKFDTKIVLDDLEQLIKFTESNNKILSKTVRNIIDQMFLTINSPAETEDIKTLEIIKKLYSDIFQFRAFGKDVDFLNLLGLNKDDYHNSSEYLAIMKNNHLKLIDELIDSSQKEPSTSEYTLATHDILEKNNNPST